MGFGILVMGYLVMFGLMPGYNVFVSYVAILPVVGCIVMLIALRKLSPYGKLFQLASYGTMGLIAVAAASAIYEYGCLIGLITPLEQFNLIMFTPKLICVAFFNVMLLGGISKLATEVGNKKLAYTARRNIYLQMVYYALVVISIFPVAVEFWGAFALVIYLFGIICFLLNLISIYTAYMRIIVE